MDAKHESASIPRIDFFNVLSSISQDPDVFVRQCKKGAIFLEQMFGSTSEHNTEHNQMVLNG